MAPVKSILKSDGRVAGPRPAALEKAALQRNEKLPKAARRIAKSPRPRLVDTAASATGPAVILWDDPFEPAADLKPKR